MGSLANELDASLNEEFRCSLLGAARVRRGRARKARIGLEGFILD